MTTRSLKQKKKGPGKTETKTMSMDYYGNDYQYEQNDIYVQALQKFWGYPNFRSMQRDIIEAISLFPGSDVVAVLGTGTGKSICFQIPGVVLGGLTVVISPLISLMQDQVHQLTMRNIPAACLHSGQTWQEQQMIMTEVEKGKIHFLYVAPERLNFMEADLRRWNPKWIIADESHCVSQFGCSFRPDYRELRRIREWVPAAKWAAFTATATVDVQQDIIEQLGMVRPACFIANVDRPNLFYVIKPRFKTMQQFWEKQLLPTVRKHYMQSGIIYCLSRRETEQVADYLQQAGIRCAPYHAGMEMPERTETQKKFMSGEIHVVSATVAMGMGIDKSNIRFILHTTLPSTIEHFQQESGRSGRDGDVSFSYLFYGPQDFKIRESFLKEIKDEQHLLAMQEKLQTAWNFCKNKHQCYHKQLVNYFGQDYEPLRCKTMCSSCMNVDL